MAIVTASHNSPFIVEDQVLIGYNLSARKESCIRTRVEVTLESGDTPIIEVSKKLFTGQGVRPKDTQFSISVKKLLVRSNYLLLDVRATGLADDVERLTIAFDEWLENVRRAFSNQHPDYEISHLDNEM